MPRDASAASDKQQAHPNGFAFRAALLVAAKRYAKWKYSAGMRRPSPVQQSIAELGGFAIKLQRVREKYAARKYLPVRPAHHNRTRQEEKRHRGRFPIEISRCAPIFIHFTGGFSPLVQRLRLPHEQKYPQPPWVQRTQELPSLICSSAGSAVATLHFGFCSAAVRSASRVKKSKIKVRRRNDIHLARRHQGLPTSPDVHVYVCNVYCV